MGVRWSERDRDVLRRQYAAHGSDQSTWDEELEQPRTDYAVQCEANHIGVHSANAKRKPSRARRVAAAGPRLLARLLSLSDELGVRPSVATAMLCRHERRSRYERYDADWQRVAVEDALADMMADTGLGARTCADECRRLVRLALDGREAA